MTQYIYEWDCQTNDVKDKLYTISYQTLLDTQALFNYLTSDGIPNHISINHIIKNELISLTKHFKKTFV